METEGMHHLAARCDPAGAVRDQGVLPWGGQDVPRRLSGAQGPRLRVVAVTSYAWSGDVQRARDADCDGYVTEPIDGLTLPGRVAESLPNS